MRQISCSATKDQIRNKTKHVTRRLGWWNLKPCEHLMTVEKAQGLKKGEHVVPLRHIVVLEVNREPLEGIIKHPYRTPPFSIYRQYASGVDVGECELEGFPELNPVQYVEMFCRINKKDWDGKPVTPDTEVNRILFDYGDVP